MSTVVFVFLFFNISRSKTKSNSFAVYTSGFDEKMRNNLLFETRTLLPGCSGIPSKTFEITDPRSKILKFKIKSVRINCNKTLKTLIKCKFSYKKDVELKYAYILLNNS